MSMYLKNTIEYLVSVIEYVFSRKSTHFMFCQCHLSLMIFKIIITMSLKIIS